MTKKNKKYVLILIIILIMIILAILSINLKEDKKLNKLESFIKDTVTTIEKTVYIPFKLVIDKVEDFKMLNNIRKKYQLLLPSIERIDTLNAENIELRRQIASLKEELNIKNTLNEYTYLNATVINRNVSYWYNTITIDKGTYNGVTENMVVVNNSGLIGRVISTTTFTSEIRLITTSEANNKISVRITDGNVSINGLLKHYNSKTKHLEIEGVSNTEKVGIDDYVYTSGLGDIFPSGILIGKVINITTDEYDLSKIIEVEPSANFDDINYVAVLKRKEIEQ